LAHDAGLLASGLVERVEVVVARSDEAAIAAISLLH
jgi:hypothetical protein